MKKVILCSLVAMMAVTAANAEIASVEYVGGKTGNVATLTTTATNLTDAINELNTGVQAAATKTALEQGLATKQDTIDNLDDIRSGAALGATALQESVIAKKGATVSDENLDKMVPTVDRMNTAVAGVNSLASGVAADLDAYKTANDAKVNKNTQDIADINAELDTMATSETVTNLSTRVGTAESEIDALQAADTAIRSEFAAADQVILQSARNYAGLAEEQAIAAAGTAADTKIATALEAYSTTTEMNQAIATATTDMATTGGVATAKSEAIAEAGTAADGKIATALEAYSTTTEMDQAIATATTNMATTGDVATAKSQAVEAAAEAAKIYIDATELEQSQTAQTNALQGYADGKVQNLQATLTSLATFPAECAEGTLDCALVIRDGEMKWEKVQY